MDGFEGDTNLQLRTAAPTSERLSLLVVGEGEPVRFALPESGEVFIGRSSKCAVPLDDSNVSRKHAQLRIGATLEMMDLGSRNGTSLGDRLLEPHQPVPLCIGDVITIGSTVMILQAATPTTLRPRRLWSHGYFEARLEDECVRAEHDGRENFAVARLLLDGPSIAATVEPALAELLRPMDVLAAYAPGEYEIMLAETGADAAAKRAADITAHLAAEGIPSHIGVACFPRDGRTSEALVAAAGNRVRGSKAVVERGGPAIVHEGAMQRLMPLVERIAAGSINALILGETGVGKEVLAHTIHRLSPRAARPLLCINCAALSEALLESELFGHERGSFTGANQTKPGLLETAEGGTVFLDEIGEMPPTIQAKLLRVIEDRQVMRVGAIKARRIDVRFVAATNRDLEREVASNRFRSDLYFRLNAVSLVIPPLRERVGEIEGLARVFVAGACEQAGRAALPIAPEAMARLQRYSWPGNIRELRNVMERAVLLCVGGAIDLEHLPLEKMGPTVGSRSTGRHPVVPEPREPPEPTRELHLLDEALDRPVTSVGEMPRPPTDDKERKRILDALEMCAGNQTRAAEMLGISRRTLVTRLTAYAVPRPRKK